MKGGRIWCRWRWGLQIHVHLLYGGEWTATLLFGVRFRARWCSQPSTDDLWCSSPIWLERCGVSWSLLRLVFSLDLWTLKSSMHTYKQNDNRWIRDLIQWITNRKFFFIISFQCKKLEKKKFLTHDSANHVTKPLNIIFIPLNITSVYVFKRRPVSIIDYVFTPFLLEVNSRQQVVLATIIVYIYIYYCFMSYFYWCAMYHRSGWHHSILSSCTLVSECGDLLLSWRWEY